MNSASYIGPMGRGYAAASQGTPSLPAGESQPGCPREEVNPSPKERGVMEHPGRKHRGLIKDSGFGYREKGENLGVEGDPGVC